MSLEQDISDLAIRLDERAKAERLVRRRRAADVLRYHAPEYWQERDIYALADEILKAIGD